jgi:prevent-host-death family protein
MRYYPHSGGQQETWAVEQTIGAFDAGDRFEQILDDVTARDIPYLVERHGEPVAAVVPIEVYEQWKRTRAAFFDHMRAVSARANVGPDEGEALVAEAIDAVRAADHARRH